MDIQKDLLALRKYAQGREIAFLVNGGDIEFTEKLDAHIQAVLNAQYSRQQINVPTSLLEYIPTIRDRLCKSGLTDSEIAAFASRFDEYGYTTVLSILALVFELDIGFSWEPGLVRSKCADLEFDDDGLLVGPLSMVDFSGPRRLVPGKGKQLFDFNFHCTKSGVAYRDLHVIPFHYSVERYNLGLSGGFLRSLSNFVAEHSSTKVRVKISQDILMDMARFRESMTRAYIRGPKEISAAKLQSDSFPEHPHGDITEHLWVEDGSHESEVSAWLFPVKGFQVMWSRNGPLKTCQAEEIVRTNNNSAREGSLIYNRYVHAIWDTGTCCFSHFDGGIRGYKERDYDKRESSSIREGRDLSDQYVKLWRLDGEIPFADWADLFVRFFDQNYLALEYMESDL